ESDPMGTPCGMADAACPGPDRRSVGVAPCGTTSTSTRRWGHAAPLVCTCPCMWSGTPRCTSPSIAVTVTSDSGSRGSAGGWSPDVDRGPGGAEGLADGLLEGSPGGP